MKVKAAAARNKLKAERASGPARSADICPWPSRISLGHALPTASASAGLRQSHLVCGSRRKHLKSDRKLWPVGCSLLTHSQAWLPHSPGQGLLLPDSSQGDVRAIPLGDFWRMSHWLLTS